MHMKAHTVAFHSNQFYIENCWLQYHEPAAPSDRYIVLSMNQALISQSDRVIIFRRRVRIIQGYLEQVTQLLERGRHTCGQSY